MSGKTIDLDFLFVATGGHPEVALAKKANFQIENGIKVNEKLETNDTSIYAAGDCASFYHNGERLRLESVGNAIDQGQTVALNIIGNKTTFRAKPWFWTEHFDKKLQIAGLCYGFTDIIERKVKDKVSFWYYKDEMLLAVDAFNDPFSYMIGKRLIEENKSPNSRRAMTMRFMPTTSVFDHRFVFNTRDFSITKIYQARGKDISSKNNIIPLNN